MIVDEISRQVRAHINVIKMVEEQMVDSITSCVELLVDVLSKGGILGTRRTSTRTDGS